jgi:hypothetical protein
MSSKSAKIVYRPIGLASSMVGGLIAGQIFRLVWKKATPGDKDAPGPLETEYPLKEIFVAAAIQGAIYAVVKAAVDRQGARLYQRWTGEWPGD